MAKEQFLYPESAELLKTLDEAARRSGVSRGQAFEDLLHMAVCSLSGGRMEEEYLKVVKKHSEGKLGRRGCDSIAELFGKAVAAMEETRGEMKDILGDLFQGAITYGEAGQFFSPPPICRLMANMTIADMPDDEKQQKKTVCDPACGSGRMLLAVAETQPHWEFVGQDVDLRCVRLTAINLALRNLYGYVVWGNSLANEKRLVYRTGFDLRGVISEVSLQECPPPVRQIAAQPPEATPSSPETSPPPQDTGDSEPPLPKKQLVLF